jgi:hypothetical protein
MEGDGWDETGAGLLNADGVFINRPGIPENGGMYP